MVDIYRHFREFHWLHSRGKCLYFFKCLSSQGAIFHGIIHTLMSHTYVTTLKYGIKRQNVKHCQTSLHAFQRFLGVRLFYFIYTPIFLWYDIRFLMLLPNLYFFCNPYSGFDFGVSFVLQTRNKSGHSAASCFALLASRQAQSNDRTCGQHGRRDRRADRRVCLEKLKETQRRT